MTAKRGEPTTAECSRCGQQRQAAEVVVRVGSEVQEYSVWVEPAVVQLGPHMPLGYMPHRLEPGYWSRRHETVEVAVLADGQRVPPKTSTAGWAAGANVCIPCRDAYVERIAADKARKVAQEARLAEALRAVPALPRPTAPTKPEPLQAETVIPSWREVRGAWIGLAAALTLVAMIAFPIIGTIRGDMGLDFNPLAVIIPCSLPLAWLLLTCTAYAKTRTQHANAMARYPADLRAYKQAVIAADARDAERARVRAQMTGSVSDTA